MSRNLLFCLFLFSTVALAQVNSGTASSPGGMQRQRPPLTGNISVSGTVVNSVTGEPISRALIQLGGMVNRAALTDAEGRFQFDGLPETQAMFVARKPGFFSDLELERGMPRQRPTAIKPNMGSLTVKLTPAGIVSGHITTVDGEPVESARVRLKMRSIQNGRRQWMDRSGAATDDDGYFRLGNLQPGTYYLFTDGATRLPNAGDEVIAPAYYPGVSEISAATPIDVRPGSTTITDLTLRKEKAYRVSGIVTGLLPGQTANVQLLNSSGEFVPLQSSVSASSSSFEIRRVPAGSYILKAFAQQRPGGPMGGFMGGFVGGGFGRGGPQMPQVYSGSIPIIVAADLTGVTIAVQPSVNIPLTVRSDFTNRQQSPSTLSSRGPGRDQSFVNLHLTRADGQPGDYFPQPRSQPDGTNTIIIPNVEPGRYRAEFMPMGGNTYVQSATYGTTDIMKDEFVVTGGNEQAIDVVLRDDAASVSGTVNCGDVQCWVLVVPDGSALQPRTVFVSPQGSFQQQGLAPGSYRLYAFDRVNGIEFTNPEAMKAYGGHSETVVLSAGQKAQVNLELTKVSDQ